jgi:hypothetical protein
MPHDLVVIFKGFNRKDDIAPYNELLKGIRHRYLLVSDYGFDVRAYFVAARTFDYVYYCFLNSYSRILADDWLLKLYSHALKPNTGLVGTTGSWESMYTNCLMEYGITHDTSFYRQVRAHVRHNFKLCKLKFYFDQFPNYHIRTNGFMISREVMLKTRQRLIRSKLDAHRLESGKDSLTNQVLNMNLKALVVDKDGKDYEKEEWYKSVTFKQRAQEYLLIADNQTDRYAAADLAMKWRLSQDAWGARAAVE